MKALLTLATFALIGGASALSADCGCNTCPQPTCCPPPACTVYTCAGSPEYQNYWKNQDAMMNQRMNQNPEMMNQNNPRMMNQPKGMMNQNRGMMNQRMMNQNTNPDEDQGNQ